MLPLRRPSSELLWRLAALGLVTVAAWSVMGGVLTARAQLAADRPIHMKPHTSSSDVDAVGKHLMCSCGCNLTVSACEGAMTCSTAAGMKEDIAEMLQKGMSQNAILASFERDFGESVLAAPKKEGFNLTAWLLPVGGLLVGSLVVIVALRRWRPAAAAAGDVTPTVDPDYLAKIEAELDEEL